MAIPKINKQNIEDAIKYINENGVPNAHNSTKYDLVTEDGNKYPPKYIIAVADHIANGEEISTGEFNAVEAKSFLEGQGYSIEKKIKKYEMVITSERVTSTDDRFSMDKIGLGDNYKCVDTYFENAEGDIVRRSRRTGENKISNQTMPRIAFQIFEKQIDCMTEDEKKDFPICKYGPESDYIRGIYNSSEEYRKELNTKSIEYMTYYREDSDKQYVIYSWNVFSTIIFVQECLKRFGKPGDQFILIYSDKEDLDTENDDEEVAVTEEPIHTFNGYKNTISSWLIESKNIILRGAPGTGKTYLAKKIATDIISDGLTDDFNSLNDEQKEQVGFVQFHPSYDYTDFVEGLRPRINDDGSMGFKLQDGVFKKFIKRARNNYENSHKSKEIIEKEVMAQDAINAFFSDIELGQDVFKTTKGSEFYITGFDDQHIDIYIPKNESVNKLRLSVAEILSMIESGKAFEKNSDITSFIGIKNTQQRFSYDLALYKEILKRKKKMSISIAKVEKMKKYVFIIDEINRGEISKIFGELFFAIDPGYRGEIGEISTQYANLHSDLEEKFYIPENVYIIGTMNDIDRSVDSFDFAMRRRFRFVELKANKCLDMLDSLENDSLKSEAVSRLIALNKEIASIEDLNENYQIGASYFLKIKSLSFEQLWTDYLQPLLQEYIRGMYDEEEIMKKFAKAYGCQELNEGDSDDSSKDQG